MSPGARTLIALVVSGLGLSSLLIAVPLRLLHVYLERSESQAEDSARAERRAESERRVEAHRRYAESEKDSSPELGKGLLDAADAASSSKVAIPASPGSAPPAVPSAATRAGGPAAHRPSATLGRSRPARGPLPCRPRRGPGDRT